jgi:hypothetical protein
MVSVLYRSLSLLFGLSALAAGSAAVYLYLRPTPHENPGLVVERPQRILTDVVAGREQEVEFRVVNRTRQTLRVVGAEFT